MNNISFTISFSVLIMSFCSIQGIANAWQFTLRELADDTRFKLVPHLMAVRFTI